MASFHDRLATAYQDPALMRARYSGNSESINAPLLRTSEADTQDVIELLLVVVMSYFQLANM